MSPHVAHLHTAARAGPKKLIRCEDEAIHAPAAIQPAGALVAWGQADGVVHHVSANLADVLGVAPEEVVGRSVAELAQRLDAPALAAGAERPGAAELAGPGGRRLRATWHLVGDDAIADIEPSRPEGAQPPLSALEVAAVVARLQAADSLAALHQIAVEVAREATGFDRAIIYLFDAAWHGQVAAESRRAACAPYLGLRFPNTDIPAQARALYARTQQRQVVDAAYQPVRLLTDRPDRPPLDLSAAMLRSISPLHQEYMHYLGARASLSVSLMDGERLVGLLSCTHEAAPHHVSADNRGVLALVGSLVSALGPVRQAQDGRDQQRVRRQTFARLFEKVRDAKDFAAVLCGPRPNMLDILDASGGAISFRGKLSQVGRTPSEADTGRLIAWVQERGDSDHLFATHALTDQWPPAAAFRELACGVLAVTFPQQPTACMVWFRPEVAQTVSWGGDPRQNEGPQASAGPPRPRRSFDRWQEAVVGQCRPWSVDDKESANGLLEVVTNGVLQRSEELAKLVEDLAHSNRELDAFAYAASHDLKEPLRAIHNFADLALREVRRADAAQPVLKGRIEVIASMAQRMDGLIRSLLRYAHIGRTEMECRRVDAQAVLASARETLDTRLRERNAELRVASDLPPMWGDQVLLGEVMTNLISNAVKYNDHPRPLIWVGAERGRGARPHYFVRDNGIGISREHHEDIFMIFRRLHARQKFGGGTGTGLTIAKRIIDRHKGKIWLESAVGEGTTFFFSLPEPRRDAP